MKESRKRYISKLFSITLIPLCLAVVVIPPNVFHHHKESDLTCRSSDITIENDLCHISVYHPKEVTRKHCNHKNHINHKVSKCEFCKFLTSSKTMSILDESYLKWLPIKIDFYLTPAPKIGLPVLTSDFGRAPPAL